MKEDTEFPAVTVLFGINAAVHNLAKPICSLSPAVTPQYLEPLLKMVHGSKPNMDKNKAERKIAIMTKRLELLIKYNPRTTA